MRYVKNTRTNTAKGDYGDTLHISILSIFDRKVIDKVTQKLSSVVWKIPTFILYVLTSFKLSLAISPHWKIRFLLKFIFTRFRKLFWYSSFSKISAPDGPFFKTNNTIFNIHSIDEFSGNLTTWPSINVLVRLRTGRMIFHIFRMLGNFY